MKVRELMARLEKYNADQEVIIGYIGEGDFEQYFSIADIFVDLTNIKRLFIEVERQVIWGVKYEM